MKKNLGAVALCMLVLSGCAVQKQLVPTGGSRSDGTVKLAYEYGAFEQPKVDAAQGLAAAKQRCAAWGYTDADPFGGATRTCNSFSSSGCNRYMVTMEYQCTGKPEATK